MNGMVVLTMSISLRYRVQPHPLSKEMHPC